MRSSPETALAYAIRLRAVLSYSGVLAFALVGIPAIPALFALLAGNLQFAAKAAAGCGGLLATAFILTRVSRPRDLQDNEALAVVAVGYVVAAATMVWPFASDGVAWEDGIFHAVSAITTTGLTTIGPLGPRSQAFLFAQAWMQWYGGLIIIVLVVFLVGPGAPAKRLLASEQGRADVISGNRARALHAFLIYGGLTLAAVAVLWLLGAGWFDALVHALAALSTGGFSTHDEGISGLSDWPLRAGVMVFALAGAVSMARYRNLLGWGAPDRRRLAHFFDADLRLLLALCVLTCLILILVLMAVDGVTWQQAIRQAPLLAVSAQTTTGFSVVPIQEIDDTGKLAVIFAMLIGGELGSTAGGIKTFRLLMLLALLRLALLRPALPPHAVAPPRMEGRPLDPRDSWQAAALIALFLIVIVLAWAIFLAYGYAPLDALFEVVSATATVGLSSGIAGPDLDSVLKGVLCVCMWMGRLELLAVVILLSPYSWFGRRAPA